MFVGRSQAILQLRERIAKVAPSHASIFITGESGVGKEVAAGEVHRLSGRKGQFVARNCANFDESLIESELFGHERGAFTGAAERRKGIFEQADGGTVFLDEVTELKRGLQAKLLRVLENQAIVRVGGQNTIAVNVRVIAASNRSPEQAIAAGDFREDLYFRLNVVQLSIPPLRDRLEDLEDLVPHLICELNAKEGKEVDGIDAESLALLRRYSWPGNIRELRNALHQAVITRERGVIVAADLPDSIRRSKIRVDQFVAPIGSTLDFVEHEFIRKTLEAAGDNRTRAAEILGVSRRRFYDLLHKDGFKPRERSPGTSTARNRRT
jgi:transcriptional regulator with PAS, ATPase and Fis domain